MHVIKPQALGLSSRPIEFRKRFGLAVSGYVYLPFRQAKQGTVWAEQSMWNFLAREMALPLIDEGIPKVTPEFLVHGQAYPGPDRNDAVAVRARLGGREKKVLVLGDRQWVGRQPSVPQPFKSMPLSWDRAYGGPGFPANLQGRGHAPVDGVHLLPNLELPTDRMRSPGDDIAPAGFGALDVMHPQRTALRGTYDEAWMKEHAPGFPPDIDWRYFNFAPRDQWFDAPLEGTEDFVFDHMHPAHPQVRGRLPGLRVRVFTSYRAERGAKDPYRLREVPMRLTTVWFFPHAERLVLVFHGLAETASDDASDIARLMGSIEHTARPRTPEHYLDVLKKRLDAKRAMIHALNDADLVSPGIDTFDPEVEQSQAVMKPDGLREDAQYRRAQVDVLMARDFVRSQGKDPDALGVKMAPREKPPTAAELPAYLEKLQAEMDKQAWAAVEDAVGHAEAALEMLKRTKDLPPPQVHRGPPTFRASEQLAEAEKGFLRAGAPFDRAALAPKFKLQELMHHLDYLKNAHMQAPALPLQGAAAATCRGEVEWLLKRGVKRWPTIDLTGADLTGLDLSGIDLSGAWLESAQFGGTKLRGTNFTSAVLAHADLRGADATGACFASANLGRARLAGAVLEEADLTATLLQYCSLAETRMRGARLSKTDLLDTTWGRADWRQVSGNTLLFYKLDLKGLILTRAKFEAATFVQCDLSGVDLRGAVLDGCSFVGCNAHKTLFTGASLKGATFVDKTVLTLADFTDANLEGANLGECDLSGARLVRARFARANLGMATMTGCNARLAHGHGALLRKAVLTHAVLAGADLKDAILQNADLRSADLRSSNLFGADLARVQLDSRSLLGGALVERARTWPRLPTAPDAGT